MSDTIRATPAAPVGLYLHVPFCETICHYCNFNRGLLDPAVKAAYVDALAREIAETAVPLRADTIFFGGGTPSLLEPREIARLIHACRSAVDVDADAEVTLEVNPETATAARLDAWRAAGVTRLSVGVQSFRDEELHRLGRRHSARRARDVVGMARRAGWDNISVDLMLWLPQQTVAQARESIAALVELEPDHASLYLLELYPNAPLQDTMARSGWSLAPDDDAAAMYLEALEMTDAAGYAQYEISNVARPGKACRHNLKYWTDGEWHGFGCGAHSTRQGARWRNVAGTGDYIARMATGRPVVADHRPRAAAERLGDALFTGLRLSAGLDLEQIARRYGASPMAAYGDALAPFIEAGYLEHHPDRLRLTRHGMLVANEIMAVFV